MGIFDKRRPPGEAGSEPPRKADPEDPLSPLWAGPVPKKGPRPPPMRVPRRLPPTSSETTEEPTQDTEHKLERAPQVFIATAEPIDAEPIESTRPTDPPPPELPDPPAAPPAAPLVANVAKAPSIPSRPTTTSSSSPTIEVVGEDEAEEEDEIEITHAPAIPAALVLPPQFRGSLAPRDSTLAAETDPFPTPQRLAPVPAAETTESASAPTLSRGYFTALPGVPTDAPPSDVQRFALVDDAAMSTTRTELASSAHSSDRAASTSATARRISSVPPAVSEHRIVSVATYKSADAEEITRRPSTLRSEPPPGLAGSPQKHGVDDAGSAVHSAATSEPPTLVSPNACSETMRASSPATEVERSSHTSSDATTIPVQASHLLRLYDARVEPDTESDPSSTERVLVDRVFDEPPTQPPTRTTSTRPPPRDPVETTLTTGGALPPTKSSSTSSRPPPTDRKRPASLMRFAMNAGDYDSALAIAQSILARDPADLDAKHATEACTRELLALNAARVGDRNRLLSVSVPPDWIKQMAIEPRAAFLLSRIDGECTIDEIIDVSGMSELDALGILADLLEDGVIEARTTGRSSRSG